MVSSTAPIAAGCHGLSFIIPPKSCYFLHVGTLHHQKSFLLSFVTKKTDFHSQSDLKCFLFHATTCAMRDLLLLYDPNLDDRETQAYST